MENKTNDRQENTNLFFSSNFPDAEEVYNINIKFHFNYYPYIRMLLMQKTARLLIRPLCLMQPGCGFTARCRLAHFAYHRRDFQLFVG